LFAIELKNENSTTTLAPAARSRSKILSDITFFVAEDMQQDAIDTASVAMEKYNTEKEIAGFIKKEFDKKYNPTWHCIVGRSFGSYVTHETKNFIFFFLNQYAVLLLKAG
jgi:dynein light chain LC8-type